ncbi:MULTISPECIES: efflux transporter outer membrane subunit [unclassified Sphingomonas]|uniref:efflux transporter outer membrane subunit n=1 Tax=unclassified Sphingomonas TaxID=196159 RepID=UPI0006FA546D|nr:MULTISPECIES: efflux transporter outer membrane subunit [unclassified Sphingomonas]KQX17739.1 transporter [Sphingomonas sp. Root1294]KQY70665.1 transporter [Sphingomonas sp. Root50]KRB91843.1 transporter [Sphingomonas sp. Root720]
MIRTAGALLALAGLAACSFEPAYHRPAPAIPAALPAAGQGETPAALDYRQVFRDPRLITLIDRALANNQDLKAALANVRSARALVTIARADLFPQLDGSVGLTTGDSSNETRGNIGGNGAGTGNNGNGASTGGQRTSYNADLGVSWEIDLFGRLRSLNNAAFNEYLGSEAAQRGARLSLVAGVANAYLTLAADRSLLAIADETRASATKSVELTRALLKGGVAPRTDLRQAETILAQAEADQASLETAVAQDRNALQLLVGAAVEEELLPASIESLDGQLVEVPAGLDSSILLRRPDVVEAEYGLRAANARIGAARSAFFPQIGLTGLAGFASSALSNLFQGSAFTWSVAPSATLPIFDGGANLGNLRYSKAQRDLALATYQKAIQSAFRDVADALARRATIDQQVAASARLDASARDSLFLANARYREGIDPYLNMLDAQRTAYGAARTLTQARLLKAQNLVTLYQSLGGDQLIDTVPPAPAGSRARREDAQ